MGQAAPSTQERSPAGLSRAAAKAGAVEGGEDAIARYPDQLSVQPLHLRRRDSVVGLQQLAPLSVAQLPGPLSVLGQVLPVFDG